MELAPHQKYVVDYMNKHDNRGIILYHKLGTGKTITAIHICKLYKNSICCIIPASLKSYWSNELT